ncbi:hypothetical protein [Aquipseudomonas alcaligenes]|uniref:hypothetical protein n=1 Tax=Aquipseudomonas alcaligenes TaxID=43263 RepID=UPI001659B919|nr:hypothetical protein [Pseudomonas alcaligenes]
MIVEQQGETAMKRSLAVVLGLALLGTSGHSFAEFDDDITRSLTIQCSYSDYKTFQFETVSVEGTKIGVGEPASIKEFQRGGKTQSATYTVKPGEIAECIFPSGNRVRAKVGEGAARPYGMCGGDPEVFASVWVNKRKIASRIWFTGHCWEESENPDVSFKFSGYQNVSVQKCHTERVIEPETSENNSKSRSRQPLSVCVDFPDISRFPRDELEYPRSTQKAPTVGTIELLTGSHEVCKATLEELRGDFYSFGSYPNQAAIKLRRPDWGSPSAELPTELAGSSESVFDFDNDGKLDRVLHRNFESNYMDGSVLLVERGSSATKLSVPASPMDEASWLIPCQMSATRYGIRDCPIFSQKGDDAGFWMQQGGKESVYFRARYSTVSPFNFNGESYIGVNSQSEDTKNFVAVVKPMPNKTFQPMCLFRKVTENF